MRFCLLVLYLIFAITVYVIVNKAKASQERSLNRTCWLFACSCGPVPHRIEEPITNRLVPGWNPSRSATLISPVCSANYSRGLASGLRPKQGLITHCHCAAGLKKGQGLNDLPQLQNRNGKSWSWAERCPALEVPAVRQAIL